MAGGNGGLQRVRATSFAESLRTPEGRETATDEEGIPPCAILLQEQDGITRFVDARGRPRLLQLHERDEPVGLGLLWNKLREHASEPQGVLAELGAGQVFALGRGVALVVDEVDHAEDRRQTGGETLSPGDLERQMSLGERAFRTDDSLRDGRLGNEESARNLLRRQPAQEAERESDSRFDRENGVTGNENEAQHVVLDGVVDLRFEIWKSPLSLGVELSDLLVLARSERVSPQRVYRAISSRGLEPSPWIVRDAGLRPLRERRDERVLSQVLR